MGYVAKPNHNGETGGWWKRVSLQTKAHHTSSWSAPIITNTSQLSFIQQGKNKIKLWELTIRVAVSVFYEEWDGPQDYTSGVAVRSVEKISSIHCTHQYSHSCHILYCQIDLMQTCDICLYEISCDADNRMCICKICSRIFWCSCELLHCDKSDFSLGLK